MVVYEGMKRILTLLMTLALLSACVAQRAEVPVSFLGDPIPEAAAEKTIEILPQTKWVNVTGGENIRFVIEDKSFAWVFNVAATVNAFDLQRIAPPGMLDRPVTAYVAPDPRYTGDGEWGE